MTTITTKWVIGNIILAAAFLVAVSETWIHPELRNVPGATGGSGIIWFFIASSTFVIMAMVNISLLLWGGVIYYKNKNWPISIYYLLIPVIWIGAFLIDNSQH